MAEANSSTTAMPTVSPSMPRMNQLFPALVQCFLVIFLGYCAGKWRLISTSGLNGIARFTGTFALPALLFSDMLVLRFDVVNWSFLLAILLSKTIVFVIIFVLTFAILRLRDDSATSVASLAAVFSTQSNDFALGLPILTAVYDQHFHPEFIQYIYLLAPISLVILNPIAFVLLEWNAAEGRRGRRSGGEDPVSGSSQPQMSVVRMVARAFFGALVNPIIFMTLLGLVFNVAIGDRVSWLAGLLQSLKASYGAAALFLLGLTMVDRIKASFSFNNLLLPSLFIFAKLIVMPLVNRMMTTAVVGAVEGYAAPANVSMEEELSMFGFLYGTFPTAPTVFVIASQYDVETKMFASAIVLCTFLSAPLMYVTAWIMMLSSNLANFIIFNETLVITGTHFAWLSIALCTLTCVFLLVTRRFLRLPHVFTFLLSLAILKMCVGVLCSRYVDGIDLVNGSSWLSGFITYLELGGTFDARFTAAMLGVSLCLIAYDIPNRGRICLVMALFCYVTSIAASVLVVHFRHASLITPTLAFRLGIPQTVASIVVLVITIVILIVTHLIIVRFLMQRSVESQHRPESRYGRLPQEENDEDVRLITQADASIDGPPTSDLEDNADHPVESSSGETTDGRTDEDDPRFIRHVVLLFYILISAVVALFLCAWRLEIETTRDPSAKVAKLTNSFTLTEFMDYVLNYGQGLFIFALFALDTRIIVLPVFRKLKSVFGILLTGSNAGSAPASAADVPRTVK